MISPIAHTSTKQDVEKYGKSHPASDGARFMEIGNQVFMQYRRLEDGSFEELKNKKIENEEKLTPQKQVLLYCYYIMRQHYCSEANLCNSFGEWISSRIHATGGRVQMIDIGCGPGTCGLAFYEAFKDISRDMRLRLHLETWALS